MNPLRSISLAIVLGLIAAGVRADERLGEQLGTIHFDVTGRPEARAHVVRGVKLLHHMMYPEADREFVAALKEDPRCALAHWGRAMAILHPLWPDAPNPGELAEGAAHLQAGLAAPPATPRERAYLEALGVYFQGTDADQHAARLTALDEAWGALAERFPEDLDAVSFGALFHLAPARFLPKDRSHRLQIEAAADLQKVLGRIPDHPGAQHYKIHAFDFPLLADRALEVCETYGSIAPDVPHALHMPTHIFTRRGLWEKSIEFNRRSAEAAHRLGLNSGALNGHYPHALDYLVYAYLQRGQYREAEAIREQLAAIDGPYSQVQPTAMAFAFAAVPARLALERQAWTEAAALPLRQPASFPWGPQYLNCDSIIRFARAIGAARSGQVAAARAEIVEQEQLFRALARGKGASYWAAQAETQLLAARAWVRLAEGERDEAIALMRRAAELEAGSDKEAVTPGEVLPAGDLLGDLLLEVGQPAEALAAYERVLAASPNRLNTLHGAGLAADRSGDSVTARRYYEQLVATARDADPGIRPVEEARAFLARHGGNPLRSAQR